MSEPQLKQIQVGNWVFEIKSVKARKVESFGQPYTGVCDIAVTDSEATVEGMLLTNEDCFTKQDRQDIAEYLKFLGFEEYTCMRYKNGEKRQFKRRL